MNLVVRWVVLLTSIANGQPVIADVEATVTTIKGSAATHSRVVTCNLVACFLAGLWDAWDAWGIALDAKDSIARNTKTSEKRYHPTTGGFLQYELVEALPVDTVNNQAYVGFVLVEPETPPEDYVPPLTCPGATYSRRKYHNEHHGKLVTCTFGRGRVTTCLCDFIGPCPGAEKCYGCMYAETPPCEKEKRRAANMEATPAAAASEIETGMIEAANAISRVINAANPTVVTVTPLMLKHYVSTFPAVGNPKVTWTNTPTPTVTFATSLLPPSLIP